MYDAVFTEILHVGNQIVMIFRDEWQYLQLD